MRLTSRAFADGGLMPPLYTCDDEDISPPLAWEGPPAETQSFALTCDDPDAPGRTWVHWVIYNIPPDARSLAAGTPADAVLPDGTQQGQNSWPRTGYGGPCPPSGTHRYIFSLYALDITLDLEPSATDKAVLLEAMEGHVLAEIALTGLYERQR
ncbi:MAG: YbhB/YbcL family Raf kinase inhibitor-like protein [Anaerolineae bacterium]|nr:YbhB/YbcL family Raf kinase inhibitor-like protein [Anaerolineae bacterium]